MVSESLCARASSTLYFLLGDHIGSTSVTANSSGGIVAELRYYLWGGTRFSAGVTPIRAHRGRGHRLVLLQCTLQRQRDADLPGLWSEHHTPARRHHRGGNSYGYDANGNMLTRTLGSNTYLLTYTTENKLATATGPTSTFTFTYDGDGTLVKKTVSGSGGYTTYYVGPHYEKTGNVVTKYHTFGSQRVALRVCTGTNGSCGTNGATSTLTYLHADHLGSASLSTNASGSKLTDMRAACF